MDELVLDFELEKQEPPEFLYKYLSVERIQNVLEEQTVRFSPLIDTNDDFEVRQTFKKVMGPKFCKYLDMTVDVEFTEQKIMQNFRDVLSEIGLSGLNPEFAIDLLEKQTGLDVKKFLQDECRKLISDFQLADFNSAQKSMEFIDNIGRRLLCFSLSERMDISPMWGHYADSSRGFVVAFRTSNKWFDSSAGERKTRLQKISYFDGMLEEPFDNINQAVISKTTDWTYEHEWRIFSEREHADMEVGSPSDPIHLFKFPSSAVDRVILGSKASNDTDKRIKDILEKQYPSAALTKVKADRMKHSYTEIPI